MLLSLNNITFEFGERTLFSNASWHIYPGERIGLVGQNGAGKSTLLKVLTGEYTVSEGQLSRSKDLSIGYFHQDLQVIDLGEDILHVAMAAYEKALKLDVEIKELENELHEKSDEKSLEYLADLYHQFDLAGGYEMEYKAAEVLEGLGFKTSDLSRPFKEFSGGWRMRVLLAQMILQQPSILLLDEPTNHLDLPSIEWIERYLESYQGAVIIVSHDRYFLDKMVDKIVEIAQQTLNHYSGNYSFYEKEKEIRNEFQLREYENQQEFIQQQERFVERFKAKATKAKQAQSIVKKLDRLERIEAPIQENKKINFRFQLSIQPGKVISTFHQVSKKYGEIEILNQANAEILRGDKIALIGANGKGKSTVLRLIAGIENAVGEIVLGHNVEVAFYAQHQVDALDMQQDILGELMQSGSGKTELELRELLGCFLFKGDDVFKKIRVLSGGEKARVALAKTIIGKSNFLLLDEPTNHLDMSSVNMLIQALNYYGGTYILVSHDRFFIQQTANKIWEIEDGLIHFFDGNYAEWEIFKKKKKENEQKTTSPIIEEPKPAAEAAQTINPQKAKNKEEKKLRSRFNKLEEELNHLNLEKSKLEIALSSADVYADKVKFQTTESSYHIINLEIEKRASEYEQIFEQLMNLEL
ncbi:MAG TPA: ABC-F family ATP-binding cassette domain-containing protein [Chitinophagaceae bacterium]|nr:ABC-F family ATP-binding cassette domain-containing protein [Chitinophagaceae bacterium]